MDTETQDYYQLLGLSVDEPFTAADLKAAYRRAARENHPDAGGDEGRFKAVQAAHTVLSDDQLEPLYRAEVALRRMRRLRADGKVVTAGDFVPYVLDVLDPDQRFRTAPSTSTPTDPAPATGDVPRRPAAPTRAADDIVHDDDHTPMTRREKASRHAGGMFDRKYGGREQFIRKLTRARRDALVRPTRLQWVVGVLAGLVFGFAVAALYDSTVLASVGLEPGSDLWFGQLAYDPGTMSWTARQGIGALGAVYGWRTTRALVAMVRRYRVPWWQFALRFGVGAAVLATTPMWMTSWWAPPAALAVMVATIRGVAWLGRDGYMQTDAARAHDIVIDPDDPTSSMLDPEVAGRLADEALEEIIQDIM